MIFALLRLTGIRFPKPSITSSNVWFGIGMILATLLRFTIQFRWHRKN